MSTETQTNAQLATRLRALAELYDANPEAAQLYRLGPINVALVFCMNKEQTAATIRAFGPGTKTDDPSGWVDYAPSNFPGVLIKIYKTNVCERVKVGEMEIPERVISARPAEDERVVPAHVEEVFEWRCGPLLDPGQEAPDGAL